MSENCYTDIICVKKINCYFLKLPVGGFGSKNKNPYD